MRPMPGLRRGAGSAVPSFRTPHSALRTRRSGFTLVEVLVVISVISILLGLLYAGVTTALRGSKEQNTRTLVAQVAVAIATFYNNQGTYPEGAAFSCPKLVEELGSLLQARSSVFIDTDGDKKMDSVTDAWGRPLIYTRFVSTAPNQAPGSSNGEGGIQPLHNCKSFDLFSTGAFADRVTGLTGPPWASVQTEALKVTNGKYTHDGEKVKAGTKPTGEINVYFGNW